MSPAETSSPSQTEQAAPRVGSRPAFVDASGCRKWLLELPVTDVARTNALIHAQLVLLADAELAPAMRFELAEALRPHIVLVQEQLAKRLRGRPMPLGTKRRELLADIATLWDATATLYRRAAEGWSVQGVSVDQQASACCRALDAVAAKIREHHHAYVRALPADLRTLHTLYGLAERGGYARQRVADPLADATIPITCELLYTRALLLESATPREHPPAALVAVERWVAAWATRVRILTERPEAPTVAPLWLSLAQATGLQREPLRGPAARAVDVSALGATIGKRIHALRHGRKPVELDLGADVDRRDAENLLCSLHRQWCEGTPRRQHERETVGSPAYVSTGLAAAHFHLSRRPFEQPFSRTGLPQGDDPAAELERIRAATNYMLECGIHGEQWTVRNESITGIGMVRPMGEREGASLSHGTLLAVRPRGGGSVLVASLQWMEESFEGDLHIGARLVPGVPTPIAARGMGQDRFFPALLLAPIALINAPSSVLLPPGTYARDRIVEIFVKGIDRIQLTGLLESGPDCERAAYMPAGTSHAPP